MVILRCTGTAGNYEEGLSCSVAYAESFLRGGRSFVTIVRRHKPALLLLKLLGFSLHFFIFRVLWRPWLGGLPSRYASGVVLRVTANYCCEIKGRKMTQGSRQHVPYNYSREAK